MTVARAAVAILATLAVARAADPPASPRGEEALALCMRAAEAKVEADKRALLARGLALAEEALAANEKDAWAHFAVFCNLGKQTEQRGVGVGSLMALRRLRREIDRTLELAPTFPDALLGKGELLLAVPRMLGGSRQEGEAHIRRALEVDPNYLRARIALARALADRGARDQARTEAERARVEAEKRGDAEKTAEVQELLATLGR